MSDYDKSDYVGTWTVIASAVNFLWRSANNRGQQAFNALAEFGQTTSTPPLSLAEMAQSYVIPNEAAVDKFLNSGVGPRGSEFLQALGLVAVPAAAVITVPGPGTSVSFDLQNFFGVGTLVEATVTLAIGAVPQAPLVLDYLVLRDSYPEEVATAIAQYWNSNAYTEVFASSSGTVVTITPNTAVYDDTITLNSVNINIPSQDSGTFSVPAPNEYVANGIWMGGTVITFTTRLTDPDGQVDEDFVIITLPPGEHTGDVVAAVCAGQIDPLPHLRAVAAGNKLTLSPADPDYSLDSSVSVS